LKARLRKSKKIMNNYVYLKFYIDEKKLLIKMQNFNIAAYEVKSNKDSTVVKIALSDLEKVEKYFFAIKHEIISYVGLSFYKKMFFKYALLIACFFISLVFIFVASFFIVDIEIIHEDEMLVKLVAKELEKNDIHKFSLRKSFTDLEKIKEKIKNANLDKIDWLEISQVGMKYVVRVEERILNKNEKREEFCNIYAKKSGLISSISVYAGEKNVNVNDYVEKGDLLINGITYYNEEEKRMVCASGSVIGKVWYQVSVEVPLVYYEKKETGKKRKNIIFNYNGIDYKIFKNRINVFVSTKRKIFDLLGFEIYVQTDKEVKKTKRIYTEAEAVEKGLALAREKVNILINESGEIVDEKVLQKVVNNSTIKLDVFMVAQEEIGAQSIMEKEKSNDL